MQLETPGVQNHFLSGGGEMGALMRTKDWSKTSLGDPSTWPQSLRTMLGVILSSKFPMFLWWGPELIQFYNDAYRPSLGSGGKHPQALGQRGEECWPEIWHIIKPLIDQVLAGGESIWAEDQLIPIYRNGAMEDVYWTFSYSSVANESGKINGVIVVCSETTQQVVTKKRLERVDTKFRNTVKQAPIGITILRGPEFIVELANETYLQLVDRTEKQFVDHPLLETLPEVRATVEPLLTQVFTTGVPFNGYEIQIPIKRFGKIEHAYFNFVYHPLKDDDGQINGIMVVVTDVTKQVESKFALEESERQFRNLVTQSPIPMAIFRGEDFMIELGNEAMLKTLWHKKLHEVQGKKLLDVFPELVDQKFPGLLRNVLKTGMAYKEYEAIAYLSTPEGLKKHYLDFEYAPLREADQATSGIMVTVTNVTEKVEARQQIKESAERLRLATEGANIATWDLDLKTRKIIYSGQLARFFGYEDDKVMSHQDMRDNIHPEDLYIVEKAFDAAMQNGIYVYEARTVQPDKSVRWVRTQGKVFFDEQQVPYRVLGTMADITDRKRIVQTLEQSEKKFRTLSDSMPQLVWTGEPDGNITYFSQSVYDYSGLTPEELNKKGWLDIVHPEDKNENIRQWVESVTTGNPFWFEHRFRRHDGEYRWQLSRAIPQKDEEGNILMWVGTSTDIHDRKLFMDQLEQKVQERTKQLYTLNQDLLKSNDDLAQFAYVASHDLQEPLRKIQTFTTRILEIDRERLTEKGQGYFARIQASSSRMQQLILDLLSYSRINAGKKHLEWVDLNELLASIQGHLKETLEQKKATIIATELPKLLAIPFQFDQLLTNIISNALKFSKANVAPVIEIKAELIHGKQLASASADTQIYYHHLSVSDNGIGFEPQYSERIFQVFQRLHGKEEYEGTGIGLSIVKKIVENHHGIVTAESQLGQGTVFHVYIPFTQQ